MSEVIKKPEQNTSFPWYVRSGTKLLRCGYTTGTCAALAAAGAAELLLSGKQPERLRLITPRGIPVVVEPEHCGFEGEWAVCSVRKDSGDDPDRTAGILITATVRKVETGIRIEGGEGIGRVTRPGLDQPVGASAINSVPRKMIAAAASGVCEEYGYPGGLSIVITAPGGREIAKKTFNPQLGIEGGISILGTSGIVEPMSEQALLDTIALELRQRGRTQKNCLILTPGNYGMEYLRNTTGLPGAVPQVKCSNYIGETIDMAAAEGFREVLLVGHIGKLVKLAGGIMNTHSKTADGRREVFCAHAALCGAAPAVCRELMEQVTTDGCLDVLDRVSLREPVMASLLEAMQKYLDRRAAGALRIGAILFSNVYGTLGETTEAQKVMEGWRSAGYLPGRAEENEDSLSETEGRSRPKFVIFGGTMEGRELSRILAEEGADVTVCVASDYGSALQERASGVHVRTGVLTQEEKRELLRGAVLCVDATHPYALHITGSVQKACEAADIRYVRVIRHTSETRGAVVVRSAEEAADRLESTEGNILLTTGARELRAFRKIEKRRLFVRVLPMRESLEACAALGIPAGNIIAMQGPFTRELNEALIRQMQIRFLVSKDGGNRGGFPEKAEAVRSTGIQLIVIGREEETGLTPEEVLALCREFM